MSEETSLLEQAIEANQTLKEEIDRLRKTVSMLRGINGTLRRANDSLRRQAQLAVENDELFKHICETGFGIPVAEVEGGLPDTSVVEAPVANGVKASEAATSC